MKVLTVILGQARSWEVTWENFKENVLNTLNCDLAVCVSPDKNDHESNPFYKYIQDSGRGYIWEYPDVDDWGIAIDELIGTNEWRVLLNLKDQLFGGIINPSNQHSGSAGIMLFFRQFLLSKLIEDDVIQQYDFFVITRSDHIYLKPHPLITEYTDPSLMYIPSGEDYYNGITDRHIVVSKQHIHKALNVFELFRKSPQKLYNYMKDVEHWNLETYIKLHFALQGILKYVCRFPRCMFTVRSPNASTRWSEGKYDESIGYIVKYQSELQLAQMHSTLYCCEEL
jgi:hypothetical protein